MVRQEKVIIFEDKDGYFLLKVRTEKKDYIYKLHKLILEYKLGRKLKPNEVSHHKNENKQDNRLENLEVKNKSKHQREHRIKIGKKSIKRICPICKGKKNYTRKMCQKCYLKIPKKRNKLGRFIK